MIISGVFVVEWLFLSSFEVKSWKPWILAMIAKWKQLWHDGWYCRTWTSVRQGIEFTLTVKIERRRCFITFVHTYQITHQHIPKNLLTTVVTSGFAFFCYRLKQFWVDSSSGDTSASGPWSSNLWASCCLCQRVLVSEKRDQWST